MSELKLKNMVGLLIVFANMAIIFLVLLLYFAGGFLFDELTTIIALIVPMFSVYTSAILKFIVANKTSATNSGESVNTTYVLISLAMPSLFCLYLATLISLKAMNIGFSNFEQFKTMLIASETIFGVYVGIVLSSMFELDPVDEGNKGH